MATPPTTEERGTSAAPLERGAGDRGTGVGPSDPYAARAGPLMSMMRTLERAERLAASKEQEKRLDHLEAAMIEREASVAGGFEARRAHSVHQQRTVIDKRPGVGFGVEWLAKEAMEHAKTEREQQAYFLKRKAALEKRNLPMVSCLTMMGASLPAYVESRSRAPEQTKASREALIAAFAKAVDARGSGKQQVFGGRGTVLLEELRARFGFETVHVDSVRGKDYWNYKSYTSDAQTRASGFVPNRADLVVGADSQQPIDVRVAVNRFVKRGKAMSPESKRLWEELKKVEYAVGVADSGYHTYVLSAGQVYEVHWDKGPSDPKLTSATPMEAFFDKWGSGVIAVPPSVLAPPKPAPH